MLSSCRRFRGRYEVGALDPHRHTCRECSAYAALVDQLGSMGAGLPLATALDERLRRLPLQSPACRDVDRLWLDDTPSPTLQSRLETHRQSCPRCAAFRAALSPARQARLELPPGLSRRLRALGAEHSASPPASIRNWQRAAAASFLLVLCLAVAVGNPYVASRNGMRHLQSHAGEVVQRWEVRGQDLLSSLSDEAQTRIEEQKNQIQGYAEGLRSRIEELHPPWQENDGERNDLLPISDV